MSYADCESAKDLVRMCLFEKKLSLFKEVIIFSIISFKIGFIGLGNIVFFRYFWFRTSCMGYMDCESAKHWVRMCLFKKSCHYLKSCNFLYNYNQF